jgi:hypothetical protein
MKLLQRLLQQTCSHRFGWPRVDAFGRNYQICLDCGTAYEYDWDGMRQTGRLKPLNIGAAAASADNSTGWTFK